MFPNHGDHDYAKVVLDPVSLAFARERLADLDDPLLRQLAWSALWDMVRDARLSSIDYLAMVRTQAPAELDVSLLDADPGARRPRRSADICPSPTRPREMSRAGDDGVGRPRR